MTMSDSNTACEVAEKGLGITLASMLNALSYMNSGSLVLVLPEWHVDSGMLALYFTATRLLPAQTACSSTMR